MSAFSISIDVVLAHEGGYVNDPDDRGGETKFGISKRSFPHVDIANLTKQDAIDLYYLHFWEPIWGSHIASQKVATCFLDFAVNVGVTRAVKIMQGLVGTTVDGKVGPKTIGAINEAEPEILAGRFTIERIRFYSKIAGQRKSNLKFLRGWINRAISTLEEK